MLELAAVQVLISSILGLLPQLQPGIRSFIESLTAQIPDLVKAGTDISQFLHAQMSLVRQMIAENRDPTQEEWDALNGAVDNELASLDAQAAGVAPNYVPPVAGPGGMPSAVAPEASDSPYQILEEPKVHAHSSPEQPKMRPYANRSPAEKAPTEPDVKPHKEA